MMRTRSVEGKRIDAARQRRFRKTAKGKAARRSKKRKQSQRAYRQTEKSREVAARYREGPKYRSCIKRYRDSAKGKLARKTGCTNYRARARGAKSDPATAMRSWWESVKNAIKLRCHWCGKVTPAKARTHDHIIALAKGGANTVANSVMACVSCNTSKRDTDPLQWNGQGYLAFT